MVVGDDPADLQYGQYSVHTYVPSIYVYMYCTYPKIASQNLQIELSLGTVPSLTVK